jgi:hypothetical protein
MVELIPKDSITEILKHGIPDAEWLLGRIESEQGWLRFPPYLSSVISNLKIEGYPLLYASEAAMAAMLLRGFMSSEEIQAFGAEMEASSPGERGQVVLELARGLDEVVERIEIPKTLEEQAQARKRFESMSLEEQHEATRVAQHFFCFFFTSFYQNLSVMVHGEKLTSLVAQAKAGNDSAFVKAIQIDKRILTADPFFSARFNRAQLESDSNFCDALAYRLKTAPYKGKIRHKSLWLAFSIFESAQLLDVLSYREIMEICDEAGVGGYDNRIQSEKHLGGRLREYREFQKRGMVTTT